MLRKQKIALFQQLVLKGFHERVLLEGITNIDRKLAKSNLVVIQMVFMTEYPAIAHDGEEFCCRNSITTTTTKLKINFKHGQPDVGFNH